jgi:Na+/H+ antiporter NhaA
VAAAIDWQRDLLPHGRIDAPAYLSLAFVIGVGVLSVSFVAIWQQRRQPQLMALFLFATCMLMAIGYLMALAVAELWQSEPQHLIEGSRAAWLWQRHRGEVVVHAIFTTLTGLSIWSACKAWQDQRH